MKSKTISPINKINPILWRIFCILVSTGVFTIILLKPSTTFLREISLASRIDFLPIIPILAVALYLSFRVPGGQIGELPALMATMALFALPLAGLWSSGHTHTTALGGIIPMGDARIYYSDALGLTAGVDMSSFSARRPLFSGLLAVFLSITNYNLMVSLAIFTALTGFASYLTIREIERTHGVEVSIFVLMIIFLFFRLHSGTGMTENIGTPLGLIGFAMLWRGASIKNIWSVALGLLITTLALNARAGAFFVLPFFVLWAGWAFHEDKRISWKALGISALAVTLGFMINIGFTRLVAVSSGVPFANFSYSLYGLASGGKPWFHIYEVHPEVFTLSEPEHSKRVYELAFELMRNHPFQSLQGAFFNWKLLFSNTLYGLYSYVAHENWNVNPVVNWALYILSALGIYGCFREIKNPLNSLVLAGVTGFFLSIPFAPPIDTFRMRQYAASVALLGILPALGLAFLLQRTKIKYFTEPGADKSQPLTANIFSVALLLTMLVGPPIVKFTSQKTTFDISACATEPASIVIRLDKGSYLSLHQDDLAFADWAPDFHIGSFRKEAHSLSDGNMINWVKNTPASTTMLLTVDRSTRSAGIIIVIPMELTPKPGKYVQLCGRYEEDPGLEFYKSIFYTEKVLPVQN